MYKHTGSPILSWMIAGSHVEIMENMEDHEVILFNITPHAQSLFNITLHSPPPVSTSHPPPNPHTFR